MYNEFIKVFAVSLSLTLVLEITAAFLFGFRSRRAILLVVLVNLLTNPAAVLLSLWGAFLFEKISFLVIQLAIECAVIFAEAMIYRAFSSDTRWDIPHPVVFSILANSFSWLSGILISHIL